MSLVTFQESRPWARSIKDRVSTRQMPPWHIDKTVGIQDFKYDWSLTDEQLDTIVRWVGGGAPRGNPEDMPAAVDWPDESKWNFAEQFDGPPDLIIESTPYTVPAAADAALTEERWARAIEARPATVAGRSVTHHAIVRLVQEEPDALLRQANQTNDVGGVDSLMQRQQVKSPTSLLRQAGRIESFQCRRPTTSAEWKGDGVV